MPIDRIISTSTIDHKTDSKIISMGPINTNQNAINDRNKNGLRKYLNVNGINSTITKITRDPSDSELIKKNKKILLNPLNSFLAHNAKFQNLHIILILLLMFCVFLIISLCSPDMIGIDNSFQSVYYPQSHNDNFIFVYDILINKKSKLRDHIKYTPRSQRINPYILHDHFNPNDDASHKSHSKEDTNNILIESEDDDENVIQEFPVRIHHLRRGFYFDTSFNDMDNEQIIKYKNMMMEEKEIDDVINDDNLDDIKANKLNKSYTGLGVQFDEEYDITVNGLLLRIDEASLNEFDETAGKVLKRETIPLQWIDFLYTKPKEFTKNLELEEEKLNTIKKETIITKEEKEQSTNDTDTIEKVKKEDIDEANSMINHVDIEVEGKGASSSSGDKVKSEDVNIDLNDLVDEEQGVILEDDKNINKESNDEVKHGKNELNVMNEENTKKYQLNVWTYIVPKEIMISDDNAQFDRIMKQSYIDVILSGCLDIGGQQFAKEFIQSTFGWTPFMIWNDDRGHSQQFEYEEQYVTNYEHEKIDDLLKKYVFKK